MCTEASSSELALIALLLGGPLAALPIGLGVMAWRRPARGWALAAAAASTLPALFILRAGADALADPSAIAVIAAAGLALVAWIVVPSRVKLRHAALALTVLAPAVLLASVVVVAMGMGPTCGELMAPPTASPSLR